jgi:hypothetical protein
MEQKDRTGSQPAGETRDNHPGLKAFFNNMSAPLPLHRKAYLVLRNNSIKVLKRQRCCGHPGEPGC